MARNLAQNPSPPFLADERPSTRLAPEQVVTSRSPCEPHGGRFVFVPKRQSAPVDVPGIPVAGQLKGQTRQFLQPVWLLANRGTTRTRSHACRTSPTGSTFSARPHPCACRKDSGVTTYPFNCQSQRTGNKELISVVAMIGQKPNEIASVSVTRLRMGAVVKAAPSMRRGALAGWSDAPIRHSTWRAGRA